MLHYITGRPGSGKSEYLLTHLRETLSSGKSAILLVPEQQAVLWESRLAREFPLPWQLRLEITNFTRLANTVFRQYGGLSLPKIDDGGRALVLWRAMLSVWDMLHVYNHGADGREDKNIPALAGAIGELKRNRVTPASLETAAAELAADEGAASFSARLGDVSLIYAAYEDMLHREYADRDDVMDALGNLLETCPFFAGKTVFVDSFYSVTPPELRILRQAAAGADDLWVSFACDRVDTGELPFARIRKFLTQMERIAADLGKIPTFVPLTEDRRHTTPGLRAIAAGLFRYEETAVTAPAHGETPEPDKHTETPEMEMSHQSDEPTPDVSVYLCSDRYEEAEAVAALIEAKVRQGCRYRDIAVVARQMDNLRGILDTALVRHGIPCFLAEPDLLSTSPAVRLFQSLLAVVSRHFDRHDLIRMIGTGLTPVSAAEGDMFAMYTETWNIRGRQMFCGDGDGSFAWSWNPDGYRTEISPFGKICLREANRARDKLLPAVSAFADIFQLPLHPSGEDKHTNEVPVATTEDICRGMVLFAEKIGLVPRLHELAAAKKAAGDREEAAKMELVWGQLCDAMDKMVSLLSDIRLDAGRFSGLFSRVISSMEIGAIPTALDEVLLGSADGIRFGQVEHVILVGAVEGEFPSDVQDMGFFQDRDRILLEGAGITLTGSSEEYLAEEYWMFYRTAVSATGTLTVLCPQTNAGEEALPSPGVDRILALTGHKPIRWRDVPLEKRVFHPAARTENPDLSRYLWEEGMELYYPGLMDASADVSDPVCIGEYFGGRMRLTGSRLDSFSACPFQYWCQYGMALREAPHAAITAPDIGTFIHAILEQFFRTTANRIYPLPMAETETLAEELVQSYLRRLGVTEEGRLGYLFLRLRRSVSVFLEAIMEEYSQGRFVPMAFELPVGIRPQPGTPEEAVEAWVEPVVLETETGVKVTLSGIIDQVDKYTAADGSEYVRVVDYKTGTRTFSLKEIRQGMHVQLLLYLFSLWQGRLKGTSGIQNEAYLPAGAVYFQVRPGEVAAEGMLTPEEARNRALDGIVRSGIWLRDEEVLEAMDAGLTGKYVPVTRKKDGTLSGRATLQDLSEFGKLYGELRAIIGEIAGSVAGGKSTATPRTTGGVKACGYCPFGAVCRIGE